MALSENQIQAQLYELAEETGFTKDTIHWVLDGIPRASAEDAEGIDAEGRTSAYRLCRHLIRGLDSGYPGRVVEVLRECRISSGVDIGKIVYALVNRGLTIAEKNDAPEDFDGIFDVEHFDEFLDDAEIRLRRIDGAKLTRRLAWALYIIGGSLVLGSYVRVVGSGLGWAGWCIGMAGWAIFYLPLRKRRK